MRSNPSFLSPCLKLTLVKLGSGIATASPAMTQRVKIDLIIVIVQKISFKPIIPKQLTNVSGQYFSVSMNIMNIQLKSNPGMCAVTDVELLGTATCGQVIACRWNES